MVSELHNLNTDSRKHSLASAHLSQPLFAAEGRLKKLFHQFVLYISTSTANVAEKSANEKKGLPDGPPSFPQADTVAGVSL
jgi:hypothetical protein